MDVKLQIGMLAKYIEEFTQCQLKDNQEVDISDFGISVPTPDGMSLVSFFIKKQNLPTTKVSLNNGYVFSAANKHIVSSNGKNVFVDQLELNDVVDHRRNELHVVDIKDNGIKDCFDISIKSPHMYYDAGGVLHHNTLVTAALSQRCEKYGRTLVIVPNQNLVIQTEADYVNVGLNVGVFYGSRKEFDKTHTICTWQSLNSLLKKTKDGDAEITFSEFIEGVETVIVDECFHPDTLITMADRSVKAISSVVLGDQILNYNEETREYKADTVVKVHSNLMNSNSEQFYSLRFSNRQICRVTGNHKFLTTEGWIRADRLKSTHRILPDLELLEKVEVVKPPVVYNLHIQNDHNYIAEGAVVANCHQLKAAVLKDLLTNQLAKVQIRWGLTGTIPKAEHDYRALQVSIGDVVNQVKAVDLQKEGILSNCHVNIQQLIDYGEYREYQKELQYLLLNEERITYIANMVEEISKSGNTLVLVDRVESCKMLAERIPNAVTVSGQVKAKDRKEEYDKIIAGGENVIVATYGVASTGISITAIYNLVLIEPGKSFVRVIQSIGRGLRKGFDKDHVEIWDITSTLRFSKRHLTERKKYYNESHYKFDVAKVNWQAESKLNGLLKKEK